MKSAHLVFGFDIPSSRFAATAAGFLPTNATWIGRFVWPVIPTRHFLALSFFLREEREHGPKRLGNVRHTIPGFPAFAFLVRVACITQAKTNCQGIERVELALISQKGASKLVACVECAL